MAWVANVGFLSSRSRLSLLPLGLSNVSFGYASRSLFSNSSPVYNNSRLVSVPRSRAKVFSHLRFASSTPTKMTSWSAPEPTSVLAPHDIHSSADVTAYKPVHLHLDWSIDWHARLISGKVFHQIEILKDDVDSITLDTSYLNITNVNVDGKPVSIKIGQRNGSLGTPLTLAIGYRSKGDKVKIDIEYSTTEQCTALGWLSKEQTAGKTNPFLYSQCQAIHCRSLVPCIDSPAHKITYTATVKSHIPVLMSALKDESKPSEPHTYHFTQPVSIPSYLIAIVGGDLEFRKLGERTGIWAEPPMADAAQWEFEADAERFLEHAEKVISPYSWTRYDSVVLPPSFPYGGMENANLTTLTPSLVSGDRSLTDVLLHELCHSWSGNLTSCANWEHFWLNEGWTVYLERLLLQSVHGPTHRDFSYIIGAKALTDALEQFTENPRFQRLMPIFKDGEDPDDAFSSIPYEKGSNFILYLERTAGGLDNFLPYVKSYFHAFYNRSVTTEEWQEHLFEFFKGSEEITQNLKKVDWNAWFHGEGLELPVKMEYDTTLAEHAFLLASRWEDVIAGKVAVENAGFSLQDIQGWNANQVIVFLEKLHLGPKVPLAVAQKIDEIYGFSKATNGEVLLRFYEVALEVQGGVFAQQAAQWVKSQGRMKFCRTIYRALNKVEPELAKKTFLDNKSFYHPIAAAQIQKDLDLQSATNGSIAIDDQQQQQQQPNENEEDVELEGDIITIFGSTGTGKTKLSVEIAEAIREAACTSIERGKREVEEGGQVQYGGYQSAEVISCDSMQIYEGLDIITNKATVEEMKDIPHHLIGFLKPGYEYDVIRFISDVKKLSNDMSKKRESKTVPIIAGGTTYYLQHLLFPGRLVSSSLKAGKKGQVESSDEENRVWTEREQTNPNPAVTATDSQNGGAMVEKKEEEEKVDLELVSLLSSLSEEEKQILNQTSHKTSSKQETNQQNPLQTWQLLHKLDPEMASRWHWRDIRKVANSLRIIKETSRRPSHWIQMQDENRKKQPPNQKSSPSSQQPVGKKKLRKLMFWLWCEPEALKKRLDDRVDEMVERGLVEEVKEMRKIAKTILENKNSDGKQENHDGKQVSPPPPVAQQNYQTGIFQTIGYKPFDEYLNQLETDSHSEKDKLENQAKEKTKISTKRYAKDQTKWVQNKLIPEIRQQQQLLDGNNNDTVYLYLLDATDINLWNQNVKQPALSIVDLFLNQQDTCLPDPTSIPCSSSSVVNRKEIWSRTSNHALSKTCLDEEQEQEMEGTRTIKANQFYTCSSCTLDINQPVLIRLIDRQVHEKGRVHRVNLVKRKTDQQRKEEIQIRIQLGQEKRNQRLQLKKKMEEWKATLSEK